MGRSFNGSNGGKFIVAITLSSIVEVQSRYRWPQRWTTHVITDSGKRSGNVLDVIYFEKVFTVNAQIH